MCVWCVVTVREHKTGSDTERHRESRSMLVIRTVMNQMMFLVNKCDA